MKRAGKKYKQDRWVFPPDIFWITPDGEIREIIGHLTAMQQAPEAYGFMFPPHTKDEIDYAFSTLFRNSYVRGRYSMQSEQAFFEVWAINRTVIDSILEFLSSYQNHIRAVMVEVWYPGHRIIEAALADVLSGRVLINPKRRK